MEQYSDASNVTQLIVLGRGMDGLKLSNASYDRAIATQQFCDAHPGVERVVFSGGHSSMADTSNNPSEAALMVSVAHLPEKIQVFKEQTSTNTIENFINSAALLDSCEPIAVLAHRPHLPRALLIARIAFQNPVVGIPAELWGARSESLKSAVVEKLQLAWTGHLLKNIEPGDLETLRERNKRDQRIKQPMGKMIKPIARLLGVSLPEQYQ